MTQDEATSLIRALRDLDVKHFDLLQRYFRLLNYLNLKEERIDHQIVLTPMKREGSDIEQHMKGIINREVE